MGHYKEGDYIYKINSDKPLQLYKILSIKVESGGNWHDGASISYIATILAQDVKTEYTDTEEYLIQYTNPMCQINTKFAFVVDDVYIY